MIDSTLYRHLWGTEEARAIFEEPARLRSWLGILVALADTQAELDIVPAEAAHPIRAESRQSGSPGVRGRETRRKSSFALG